MDGFSALPKLVLMVVVTHCITQTSCWSQNYEAATKFKTLAEDMLKEKGIKYINNEVVNNEAYAVAIRHGKTKKYITDENRFKILPLSTWHFIAKEDDSSIEECVKENEAEIVELVQDGTGFGVVCLRRTRFLVARDLRFILVSKAADPKPLTLQVTPQGGTAFCNVRSGVGQLVNGIKIEEMTESVREKIWTDLRDGNNKNSIGYRLDFKLQGNIGLENMILMKIDKLDRVTFDAAAGKNNNIILGRIVQAFNEPQVQSNEIFKKFKSWLMDKAGIKIAVETGIISEDSAQLPFCSILFQEKPNQGTNNKVTQANDQRTQAIVKETQEINKETKENDKRMQAVVKETQANDNRMLRVKHGNSGNTTETISKHDAPEAAPIIGNPTSEVRKFLIENVGLKPTEITEIGQPRDQIRYNLRTGNGTTFLAAFGFNVSTDNAKTMPFKTYTRDRNDKNKMIGEVMESADFEAKYGCTTENFVAAGIPSFLSEPSLNIAESIRTAMDGKKTIEYALETFARSSKNGPDFVYCAVVFKAGKE